MSLEKNKFFWRINNQITAREVRVIGDDGKQIGVMSVSEALGLANGKSLDLIEIAPKANPPVTKIADIKKFLYMEEKKARLERKKAKAGEMKEVRFSPFIADNDFNVRVEKIKGFLAEGSKIRAVVVFTNRQMGKKDWGYTLLRRLLDTLGEGVKVDMQPKFIGRYLIMIFTPIKGKII